MMCTWGNPLSFGIQQLGKLFSIQIKKESEALFFNVYGVFAAFFNSASFLFISLKSCSVF
ncbi:hypothetical protein F938_03444 [Acinetobacter bereziniae LMG 1003 = CIP 70.12]|uniref:Uncharacterized protein n=2 Tax=Acinetobacter bereziniae TaxID=106648 RepID=N9EF54_ACIBZ|nr:hypothetical protein F963_01744 [Acinetobacter bereziniae NIPH 3]ENV91450.1 hypothetical protein F938_03444 [Acinetobacter bereziniae LMG 1003 = CIP 70.12]